MRFINGFPRPAFVHKCQLKEKVIAKCVFFSKENVTMQDRTTSSNDAEQLVQAVEDANLSVVKRLIRKPGIDKSLCDVEGLPLVYSVIKKIGKKLDNANYSPDQLNTHKIAKSLIKNNFEVNQGDHLGNTALHKAIKGKHVELIKALIKKNNCDVNAKNNDGETPLSLAVESNDVGIFRQIVNAKKIDPYVILNEPTSGEKAETIFDILEEPQKQSGAESQLGTECAKEMQDILKKRTQLMNVAVPYINRQKEALQTLKADKADLEEKANTEDVDNLRESKMNKSDLSMFSYYWLLNPLGIMFFAAYYFLYNRSSSVSEDDKEELALITTAFTNCLLTAWPIIPMYALNESHQLYLNNNEYLARNYTLEGDSYYINDNCRKAIEYYKKAIKQNPDDDVAHNNLGLSHHKLGNYTMAIFYLNKAIELNPKNPIHYYNRALTRHSQGNITEAEIDLSTANELLSQNENLRKRYNFDLFKIDQPANLNEHDHEENSLLECKKGLQERDDKIASLEQKLETKANATDLSTLSDRVNAAETQLILKANTTDLDDLRRNVTLTLSKSSFFQPLPQTSWEVIVKKSTEVLKKNLVKEEDIFNLLNEVGNGHLKQVEENLKKNNALLYVMWDMVDVTGKAYKNITVLQYAFIVGDLDMCDMLLKEFKIAGEEGMIRHQLNADVIKRHGGVFTLEPTLKAYKDYHDNYNKWNDIQRKEHWCKQVGCCQQTWPAWLRYDFTEPGLSKWVYKSVYGRPKRGHSQAITNWSGGGWLGRSFAWVRGWNPGQKDGMLWSTPWRMGVEMGGVNYGIFPPGQSTGVDEPMVTKEEAAIKGYRATLEAKYQLSKNPFEAESEPLAQQPTPQPSM